jgi:hypothetical protein
VIEPAPPGPDASSATGDNDSNDSNDSATTSVAVDEGGPAGPSPAGTVHGPLAVPWLSATTVAVVIVLVVVTSAFAVLAFTTDDGAATPEEATRDMLDAVESRDLLGALEALPPGERKALKDGVTPVASELRRLGLITDTNPAAVPGAEVAFDGVELRTTEIGKDVTAVDLVGGRASARLPAGDAPLTADAVRLLDRDFGVTVDGSGAGWSRDFATSPLRLVTIREGGGWHVSLAYSVAEALRTKAGYPDASVGDGPLAIGSNTPDEAVRDLIMAYADADAGRLVSIMYPDESRAVYDYAPLFLPPIDHAVEQAVKTGSYEVQLNRLGTKVEGTGGTRKVRITGLDLDIRDALKKSHLTFDGRCFHSDERINDNDDPYAKTDTCSGDRKVLDQPLAPRDNPVSGLAIFGGGADLPTFTVVERNGRWFVSPTRTLGDSLSAALSHLSSADADAYSQRLGASVRGGVGAGLSGEPPAFADPSADEATRRQAAADLFDGCTKLTTGPSAEAVTKACVKRLVDGHHVDAADLPAGARPLIG